MAGKLRRADPEIAEDPLLMRALRDFNKPKIFKDDLPIFLQLIVDLFPGIEIEPKDNPEMAAILKKCCKAAKLQPEDPFITKCI
jgi:dynein heavy chain